MKTSLKATVSMQVTLLRTYEVPRGVNGGSASTAYNTLKGGMKYVPYKQMTSSHRYVTNVPRNKRSSAQYNTSTPEVTGGENAMSLDPTNYSNVLVSTESVGTCSNARANTTRCTKVM